MKKIFTLISILSVSVTGLWAQATPNAGFENWTTQGFPSYSSPDNWDCANSQTAITGIFTVVKATGADVHSGSAAVKLITKNVLSVDAPGVVTTGTLPTSAGDPITGGIPYTLRPDSIAGWYKYTPQGGDNGFAEFMLFGSAANNADTVAKAKFTTPAATVGTYTRFSAPLVYFSTNAVANSIWLLCSSKDDVNPVINSMAIFDDLELIFNPVVPVSVTISSQTNVSCNGGNNGTATVAVSGGSSPYTYSWSNGQNTATATGLSAGTYTVTVTGTTGGSASASVTITQPAVLSASVTATNCSCNGGNNGTASVTATGGTSPYTYLWSNGQSTATAAGLSAGTYSVTVTDANSCTQTSTATISQPTAISVTVSATDASCGSNDGTATASASGGTGTLTYLWSTGATTQTITGLAAGAYNVTVTDANACTNISTANVSNSGAPVASISNQTNVSCNGGNNGSASVLASGGATPYTYSWNTAPVQTTQTATGLSAGNYSVSVTDTSGCAGIASVIITEPVVLTATTISTPDSGSSNGTATVFATGGTTSYTYLWSAGGQTSATATGLASGSYSVTVTDANSCTINDSVTVGAYVGIQYSILNTQYSIYPNPAVQSIFVVADNAKDGFYEIKILNIIGQVLFSETFEHTGGSLRKEVKLGEISAGWVVVISEETSIVLPFIKTE